ncbi:D-alanyl-D-alanine carboxypeptidase [Pedobacter changchengzhani]|nr:D-alanyl-D-alanine carboxypeptidase [Pedobacter changchengzhani]
MIAKKVDKQFKQSTVIRHYMVGFALYDLQEKKMLYQRNADQYFTPASNTKLYTFYAALKMLPENMPALKYVERNDSLIFWGTGDPSFLHSTIKSKKAYNFLGESKKKLFFAGGRYSGNALGNGWSWDDYNDYYQPEITEFPIADNMVTAKFAGVGKITIEPKMFRPLFELDSNKTTGDFYVIRNLTNNHFTYNNVNPQPNYKQQIPYKTSLETTVAVLADTLHQPVKLISLKMPKDVKIFYGEKRDTVLKHMLLPSDNFIAEQLLLVCGNQINDTLNTEVAIKYMLKNYMSFLPDPPRWVDGSGLSRKNLFTPRDMISILDSIYHEVKNKEKLFSFLPAGGKSGTLKNAYPKTDNPFVFGKTGTLSGVHNQSGYVLTKKGKIYIYSFMNNNFVQPTATIKTEMVRIVTYIHDNF